MIKVKDGYAKLVGTTASGSASHILLSNGGIKAVSDFAMADGTNATGTWSIDISGNAKSSTLSLYLLTGVGSECDANTLAFSDHLLRWYSSVPSTSSNIPTSTGWLNGILALPLHSNGITAQLYFSYSKALFYRSSASGDWNQIAYTTSDITGNASTASKLQNKVKIWGLDFDGSSDVTGDLLLGANKILGKDAADIVNAGSNHLVLGYGSSEKGWPTYVDGDSIYLRYGTSHSVGMFLDSSGKVGIGNVAPQQKLDVSGKIKADALYLTRSNGDVAFTIAEESGTNGYNITASGGSSFIRFYTNSGGSSAVERMRIHTNGYVGIGTSSPTLPLSVNGQERIIASANASSITLDTCALIIGPNTAGHSGYSTGIGFNSLSYGNYINHIHAWIGLGPYTTTATAECYPLVFATNGSTTTNTAPVERMRITPDGNVGIGDSNPAYKLEVAGTICGTAIYANRDGSNTAGGVSLYSNSDPMTYGIAFRGTGTYGTHGYVTAANDWATYLTMSDTAARGWIFRRGSTNVASIAGSGNMAINENLEFSNGAHIATNRTSDYHYSTLSFSIGNNSKNIGMYSGPEGEAGGVVVSPDGCLIYNSSDSGFNLDIHDKDLGGDLTAETTRTFAILQSTYYAWSRGGFTKNGSDDSYVLLGGGGHKLESSLSVNYATSASSATYAGKLSIHDIRDATRNPNYFDAQRMTAWFNNTGTPDGNWYSGIHMKGWTNGYTSWELCSYSSTGTANDYNLYFRSGNNTTWGSWKTIITSGNIGSQSVNYATSAGSVAWGNVTGKPSTFTPSTHYHNYFPENTAVYFRDPNNASWRGGMYWGSAGNEALCFVAVNANTSFRFFTGSDLANWTSSTWQGTPSFEVNKNGAYAPHFYESSDIKLKTNVENISTTDNIPQLKKFNWKSDGSIGYGLIAQELEEMGYSELVSEGDGYKTVNYSAALSLIVGKLLVKIQEIEKENKELRDEINNLKTNKLWQS